jgi:6-phosphogluconolactonase
MRGLLIILVVFAPFTACKSWGKFWQTEIVYPSNPLLVTQNVGMSPATPSMPGAAQSCSVSPALPEGLSLASDCTISGTPTRGQGALPYKVTADIGSDTVSGELRIRVLFQPKFLYATNIGDTTISLYTINSATGALTFQANYATGNTPRFVLRDPTGNFIYVANWNASSISAFTINQTTGALTAVAGSPFSTSVFPYSLSCDPEGKFLFAGHEDAGVAAVSAYTINGVTGVLTAVGGSPFAAAGGAKPVSVYVSPDGRHLYAGSSQALGNPNTFGYAINPQTGALTQLTGSPFGELNNGISAFVEPTGKYVYYAQYNGGTVAYTRESTTGTLSLLATSPFATGAAPTYITGDVNSRYIFVANSGDTVGTAGLTGYAIDANGSLSALTGSPFTTGKNPASIAIDETSRFMYVVGTGETNPTVDPIFAYQFQSGSLSFIASYSAGVDAASLTIAGSNP